MSTDPNETMGLTKKQRSTGNITRLTTKHLERYRDMLKLALHAVPGFRIDELRDLIAIWEKVERNHCEWDDLEERGRQEIYDAVMSGE